MLPRLLSLVLACCCAQASLAHADEPNLRLRIHWGGGPPRQWEGELQLTGAEFSNIVPLGLEADTPGTITYAPAAEGAVGAILANGTLRIRQASARQYDGLDVTVEGPLSSTLTIDMRPADGSEAPPVLRVTLEELLSNKAELPLGDDGSRLEVRRAPGDSLRVLYDRDTLVFDPGEEFSFEVDPHFAGLDNNPEQKLKIALVPARDTEAIETTEHALLVTPAGDWTPIEHTMALPNQEGAFDILLTVEKPNSRLGGQFLAPSVVLSRRLQVVVLSETAPREIAPVAEQIVAEIDPANPDFWERLRAAPQLRRIPGIGNEPESNDRWRPINHQQARWIQLDASGWIAYPLPTNGRERLHVLEIEYPSDIPQDLGVSILQLNAAGEMVPPSVDTAVHVPPAPTTAAPQVRRHRVYFWPHGESPLLLLTNRGRDRACYGRIRILTGPAHLPVAVEAAETRGGRQALAVFDRPWYPRIFSASQGLDYPTGRSLDDWKTFLDGGNHLSEYLAHAGYGGAMVAANCEGSSLYPSELLRPSPRYDQGVFFANGQHAERKDVLELLFRQFDRNEQTLVPIVQFTMPLPQLERQRQQPGAEGIALVDPAGATWRERHATPLGMAPYYNPLDPRVQQAMKHVVEELVERYGDHPSFGGVSLQLSADGYAMLPGLFWGCDDVTLARFAEAHDLPLPAERPLTPDQRAQLLSQENITAWKQWRAEEMTHFYEELAEVVRVGDPRARLYLSGNQLIDRQQLRIALRPTLPSHPTEQKWAQECLMTLGIDTAGLTGTQGVVFMRPRYYSPLAGLVESGPALEFNRDHSIDGAMSHTSGAAAFHAANILLLPELDEANPLGATDCETKLMPIATPSGSWNRRRFIEALAVRDMDLLTDGGWSIPLGQEVELSDFLATWRRLPDEPFETLEIEDDSPLVVRTLRQDNRLYLYILNNSRWDCTARLEVGGPASMQFVSLHGDPAVALESQGNRNYSVVVPPYGMVAGFFTQSAADIRSVAAELPRGATREVAAQAADFLRRVESIPNIQSELAPNGGFETVDADGGIEGWEQQSGAGVDIRVDPLQQSQGRRSLRMSSSGPVAWVQSEPLELVGTGRLIISFALRTDNPQQQPELRLAINGRLPDRQHYDFAPIGAGQAEDRQLTPEWRHFNLKLDNLPPEGLKDLRIEIDLMGAGTVWIDDVRVTEPGFDEADEYQISKFVHSVSSELQDGNVVACDSILESYWPRFILSYVGPAAPQVAAQPLAPIVPRAPQPAAVEEAEDEDVPLLDRIPLPRFRF